PAAEARVEELRVAAQLGLGHHVTIDVEGGLGIGDEAGKVAVLQVNEQEVEAAEPFAVVGHVREDEKRADRVEDTLLEGAVGVGVRPADAEVPEVLAALALLEDARPVVSGVDAGELHPDARVVLLEGGDGLAPQVARWDG